MEPSDKQLKYLADLGYEGPPPTTMREAYTLIQGYKPSSRARVWTVEEEATLRAYVEQGRQLFPKRTFMALAQHARAFGAESSR